ncbi:MAG: IPT/TIG domain-containing protein, partial [Endomicrobiales bacterium]
MKKVFLFAALLVACAAAGAFAAPPALLFSDLTSGPNTGGKDDRGVFVTVVGKNFGATQGASSVLIGGGKAAAYPVWSDTKITFQLGPEARTGDIVVTTPEGSAGGIRFTVRPGRIFFVSAASPNNPGSGTFADPWRSPASFFGAQQAGDTCYFRGGTYSGQYGNASRPYNVSFYNSPAGGTADNEIAWAGYPNETALFKADDNTVYNGAFEFLSNNQYIVLAGLSIYGRGDGREQVRLYSDNDKLVNCKIEGIKTLSYAMIGITASNLKIWGNECFGSTSANKLDHIFYFQGGGDNVDIGWNYVHDNDIAVGPIFSWNLGSATSTNVRIHDNWIDGRNSSDILRLAGIWSGGGGSISFYNNVIIGTGGSLNNDTAYNAIYVGFGAAYIYNNTFYLS